MQIRRPRTRVSRRTSTARTATVRRITVRRSTALTATLVAGMAAAVLSPVSPATAYGGGGAVTGERAGPRTKVVPTLVARATYEADAYQPGPPSGADVTTVNGRTGPFPGQVLPGFSAVVDNGDGTFWAMPDNGFGAKDNSEDFLLRIYLVRPHWETAAGGEGRIEVLRFVSLRDSRDRLDFPIVREDSAGRKLTGGDFDIESLVRDEDGSFWIGDEFGPFILHFGPRGVLLEDPVPFPDGKSPQNPYLEEGETANVPQSRGFEAMGGSRNGRYLYPVVEGPLVSDPLERRRWIYEFDKAAGEYTGQRWAYQTDQPFDVVGDAFVTGRHRMLLVERDDFEGPAAVIKRVYSVDLDRTDADGYVSKRLRLDALAIANPHGIGSGDGYGTGRDWSFPVQSFETIVRLRDGRLLIANDNNYPGNDAREPGTPDDVEMAVIRLRRVAANRDDDPLVIAHRGASGYRPEHTLAAYGLAIRQCADYIEPDLVSTKDGVLVARHENEISTTTDVATRPEFADLKTTKVIDGTPLTGWFTEDFTFAQLRTLRAIERLPIDRPQNKAFNELYQVPTFDEVLDFARHSRTCEGRRVGVYPETKHPTYFDSQGLSLEEPLLHELGANGFGARPAPVYIQSFETGNLRELDSRTDLRLVQLIDCDGAPYDLEAAGDPTTYADIITPRGLREVATYAEGIGPCKDLVVPREADSSLAEPTSLTRDAHRAGLVVHAFTFRRENRYLPLEYRSSEDLTEPGDLVAEIRTFLRAGIDGYFTDNPDLGVQAAD